MRRGVIRRGYSWLLRLLPAPVWGGRSVTVETDVGPMSLPTTDRSSSSLLFVGCIPQEKRETALVRAIAKSCQTMLDIGAQYGWYLRVMCNANSDATVFAFEPDKLTFSYLSDNARGFTNARCFNVALSNKDGGATLWLSRTSNLNSMVRNVGRSVQALSRTLDGVLRENAINTVDLVKCDVEGGELHVLDGAKELLASAVPPIWMLEITEDFWREAGYESADVLARLRCGHAGGRLYTQDQSGIPIQIESFASRIISNNIFYVPAARLEQFETAIRQLQPV